jgi:hypothetical protein
MTKTDTRKRRKPKFRKGQLVRLDKGGSLREIQKVEFVDGRYRYWFGGMSWAESCLRPLTATEIGPRARKEK